MSKILLPIFLLSAVSTVVAMASEKSCQPAKHATLPSIAEFTYHKARAAFISAGWQPLQTKSLAEAKTDPDISSGNGALFWAKGYVEVEGCAGTGASPCAFLFKDAYGNRLRVTTAGEEYPKEKAFAKVTGFRFVCEP